MQSSQSTRPKVKDILAASDIKGASDAGISEKDIAELVGVPSAVLKVAESFGNALRIRSTKHVEKEFSEPYAAVVTALALALQNLKHGFTAIFDTSSGSVIEAQLPGDLMSLSGSLSFAITEKETSKTIVAGTSEIKGQRFDWGKGDRALKDVIDKTDEYLRLMGS